MKIKTKLISLALIPMIISSIIVGTISVILAESYLSNEQSELLQVACKSYNGDVNFLKDQGIDISVFKDEKRVKSSIKGAVNTKASDKVIEEVLIDKNEYFSTDIDIQGVSYFGYYTPTSDGMLFAGKKKDVVTSSMNKMATRIVLLTIVFAIMTSVISYVTAKKLAVVIKLAASKIEAVSNGKLGTESNVLHSANDELSLIHNSINLLTERLCNTVLNINDLIIEVDKSSENLVGASAVTLRAIDEITDSIEEISGGAQQQNEISKSMVSDIQEIHNDIADIRTHVNKITGDVYSLDLGTIKMKTTIEQMIVTNQKVNSTMNSVSDSVKETHNIIEEVKGIISIIGDIATQTQLLSLNAAIEAARAGDSGKGFAVVAKSISDLSESTSKQVYEITNIIETLIAKFGDCQLLTNDVLLRGHQQKESLDATIQSFEELSKSTKVVSDRVQLINNVINQAVIAMENMSQEVLDLSDISDGYLVNAESATESMQGINKLTDDVTLIVKDLNNKVSELDTQIKFFKLD